MYDWTLPLTVNSSSQWMYFTPLLSLWRVLASVLILLIGVYVSRSITHWLRRVARKATSAAPVKDSPVSALWETTEGLKGTGLISTVVFWMVMIFFIAWAGELLGIRFLSNLVSGLFLIIPRIFSATIVLILGVVLAGVGERVIKQQAKRFAPQQAVLVGTFFSYGIMILFALMAVSELGIASNFILILFSGCVMALALGAGLAFGLGAKDLVADSLRGMVQDEHTRRKSGLVEPAVKKASARKAE